MRKQLLGVFLPLIALMLLAAAAETQSTGTGATKRAALQRLDITRGEDGISIELTAQGQMNPKLSTLDRPARVVLDLPATVAATNQRQFTIDSDVVKGVRVGMDDQTPPTTRVVVDLAKACPYELVPSGENKLILKLHPVATAVAPDMAFFVAVQFLARVFLAVQVAVAWTVAAEELPAERRGFGFGILALASALGTGQGAILEAAVLAPLHASWRWLYVASVPVVVVILVLRRSLPESRRYEDLVASGRMHGQARVLFAPPHRNRLFLICGTAVLANLTTQATLFAIDYMQTQRHLGASAANLVVVGAGLICLPVLTGAGRLSDRVGRRPVCAVALVIQAVGVVLFFNVATTVPVLLAMLAVTYVGVFGAWTTGNAFGVEAFPTALRATAGAAVTMAKLAGQCASFIGSAVLIRSIGHSGVVVGLLAIGPSIAAVLVARAFPETSGQELADTAAGHLVPAEVAMVAGS